MRFFVAWWWWTIGLANLGGVVVFAMQGRANRAALSLALAAMCAAFLGEHYRRPRGH